MKRPTAASLHRKIAEAEAVLAGLRENLAKVEAAASGQPAPPSGLDLLWAAALPMARQRSSKHLCRKAWAAIPPAERPTVAAAIAALKQWNQSDQWRLNEGIYAPGLHRYLANRMWECPPEAPKPRIHRGMSAQRPPMPRSGDAVTDPAEIAKLLKF